MEPHNGDYHYADPRAVKILGVAWGCVTWPFSLQKVYLSHIQQE